MTPKRNPADTINEAVGGLAERLTDALAATLDEDAEAADDQVKMLESPAIAQLRDDAETVADRFEAVSATAGAAQRRAHSERAQLRSLRPELEEALGRLVVAPIEEHGNGRRKR